MKVLGRILWFLGGLLYRLIVLVLFERWISFPVRGVESKPDPSAAEAESQPKRRAAAKRAAVFEPKPPRRAPRERSAAEPAFFDAYSIEPSPDLAAKLEGEHWLPRSAARASKRGPRAGRETFGSLLRDKRALRDAVVLGDALGMKRTR